MTASPTSPTKSIRHLVRPRVTIEPSMWSIGAMEEVHCQDISLVNASDRVKTQIARLPTLEAQSS